MANFIQQDWGPPDLPLILFAIPRLDDGGPDRVVSELLHGLPRDRFRFALLVERPGGRLFDALPIDVAVHALDTDDRYPVRAFARAVRDIGPALVMTTLRMNLTGGLAKALRLIRTPLVARQANAIAADFQLLRQTSLVKHRIAEWATRRALRQADAIVAQSIQMAAELAGEARVGQRIATIGNPVDLVAIKAAAAAQLAMSLPGSPALLSVGRLMPQKGYDLLIAAMPAIIAAHPGAQLTILGEGGSRAALERQAAELGLSSVVHLPGQSATVLSAMKAADLFVSSSRYEGFSNAMLEAMALGTPVAATDCPGATREMVEDGVTGMLAAELTPQSIADAVLRALHAERATIGPAARAHLAANFHTETIMARYADLFGSLVAQA